MIAQIAYLIAARTDNSRSGGGKKIDTHTRLELTQCLE